MLSSRIRKNTYSCKWMLSRSGSKIWTSASNLWARGTRPRLCTGYRVAVFCCLLFRWRRPSLRNVKWWESIVKSFWEISLRIISNLRVKLKWSNRSMVRSESKNLTSRMCISKISHKNWVMLVLWTQRRSGTKFLGLWPRRKNPEFWRRKRKSCSCVSRVSMKATRQQWTRSKSFFSIRLHHLWVQVSETCSKLRSKTTWSPRAPADTSIANSLRLAALAASQKTQFTRSAATK